MNGRSRRDSGQAKQHIDPGHERRQQGGGLTLNLLPPAAFGDGDGALGKNVGVGNSTVGPACCSSCVALMSGSDLDSWMEVLLFLLGAGLIRAGLLLGLGFILPDLSIAAIFAWRNGDDSIPAKEMLPDELLFRIDISLLLRDEDRRVGVTTGEERKSSEDMALSSSLLMDCSRELDSFPLPPAFLLLI